MWRLLPEPRQWSSAPDRRHRRAVTTANGAKTPSHAQTERRSTAADGAGSTYAYDQADRLTAYKNTTYTYDGDGLRTKKATSSGSRPHTLIGDGSTAYIAGPDGLPLEQITSPGVARYYHQDQLGSTRAITEQTGTVSATYNYDPYGNPTAGSDPLGDTGLVPNPFGYAGQYTDQESGLQYLRARYYDPATLNFITRDPITPTTRTPYAYTNNDPLNNSDPTGLECNTTAQDGGFPLRLSS